MGRVDPTAENEIAIRHGREVVWIIENHEEDFLIDGKFWSTDDGGFDEGRGVFGVSFKE